MLSPKKLLNLFLNAKQTAQSAKKLLSEEWYFSSEGQKAYNEACYLNSENLEKKTRFFFDYLCKTRSINSYEDNLKLAFFLAFAIDGSTLPYGKYPDILMKNQNPFLRCFRLDLENALGILLNKKIDASTKNVYKLLSFDSNTEEWKLQRAAISIFGYNYNSSALFECDISSTIETTFEDYEDSEDEYLDEDEI